MGTTDQAGTEQSIALIVEDNHVNRLVAVQMLKRAGVVADEAASGEEALTMLATRRYDVVLMDVQMPGIDGMEATRALRSGDAGEINRWVPVVAMTAYSSSDDEAACYAAGMSSYLSKPLSLQAFVETVQSAVAAGHSESATDSGAHVSVEENLESDGEYDRTIAIRAAGGDVSAAIRLAQAFVESIEAELPRLRNEVAGGDLQSAAIVSRALWTSAAQAGAIRLRRLLRKTETAATGGDRTIAREAAAGLPAALAVFRTVIGSDNE